MIAGRRAEQPLPAPVWERRVRLDGAAGTREFGAALAGVLRAGDVLILTGELGAGKTTLTQGLGAGLGVREGVISPTFVLSRIHPSLADGPDLVHVDAYRLRSAGELTDLDLEATADRSVTVVEWGRGMAESLAGFPEDPEASWLDVEVLRARGGADLPDGPAGGDAAPDAPVIVTDFSDEEGEAAEEVRTAVVRAHGPRWAAVALP
ncbi:tRNA (adenosine(37)-N6)-threonylcarbamoyltransferase complex ATPase subunit type 1 TsaE [Micrococcus sp. ACRRV]|uniref:tRNA (adenosine(37)-N6)-threonylcarbamoyltransferase complex ATPase subunit type 1 TsaE n=1 Tax=Micrococcus sp. ACRRV TaxID=2918203 RepID=UPI001EF2C02F|nr:tRNA (adenosine(37)-N6)-threonylcarbamoyltransferase complex ATPase subunit type 1 TsaE [Micrococcus sp. ACRRV]MCG7421317.1 tRNA (adenosine(37)-N6)-threonylcarbamoyltransferase complex ATPase subunit type 1 TsaE [Micrococcus sp. ACRRV]